MKSVENYRKYLVDVAGITGSKRLVPRFDQMLAELRKSVEERKEQHRAHHLAGGAWTYSMISEDDWFLSELLGTTQEKGE